MNDNYPIVV